MPNNALDDLYVGGGQKADFTLMAHLTQHFKPRELGIVLKNAADVMNDGAELVWTL